MTSDWTQLGFDMIQKQLVARGIHDPKVLRALGRVERHLFLPDDLQEQAYEDHPVSIGFEQTISQPYIVAFMTQALSLKGDEKILEVGCGCGYQTAVLADILQNGQVYALEIVPELAEACDQRLKRMGFANVTVVQGDGFLGWPQQAPFDAIIVAAAPKRVPQALLDQLKVGGRLVIPVSDGLGDSQFLKLFTRDSDNHFTEKVLLPVRFVPMTGQIELS